MSRFIQNIEDLDKEWLAEVLGYGEIREFEAEALALNTANAIRIRVQYLEQDKPQPKNFFLKIVRSPNETGFYQHIAPKSQLPQAKCYYAAFRDEEGWGNLLFEDISASHGEIPKGLPASEKQLQDFMSALAQLHGEWWENESLAQGDLSKAFFDMTAMVFGQVAEKFPSFVDAAGDALSPKRRKVYERILAAWPLPDVQKRLSENRAVSLVHGDSHFGNFAISKGDAPSYLQDWSLWHRDLPAYDLSYLFSRCFPDYRRRFESSAIECYHAALGRADYSLEACREDYRLMMIPQTLWPVFFHDWAGAESWYRLLETSMTAFEDLDCEGLL